MAENYFGSGSDGALSTTGNVNWASTLDSDMIVKNFTNLTINTGHTVTVTNRCKGLLIYCTGDCTVTGTLSMTARGANVDASAAGVSATGIRLPMFKPGEEDTLAAADFAGCGTAAIAAVANQSGTDGNGKIFTIERAGAAGGAALPVSDGTHHHGNPGSAGGGGQSGGGGGGSAAGEGAHPGRGGAGSAGTCFSGGTGGGAGSHAYAGNGAANGGAGGAGNAHYAACGGGAGNPGGAGDVEHPPGTGGTGQSGTGGLLIVIVGGDLTINTGSIISSSGKNGGAASGNQWSNKGGGATGGGAILIIYAGSLVNNGAIEANGGSGGVGSGSNNRNGGAGGAGNIQGPIQITAVPETGPGWISPTGHENPHSWPGTIANAYDGDGSTFANAGDYQSGWTSYIYLTYSHEIRCTKVGAYLGYVTSPDTYMGCRIEVSLWNTDTETYNTVWTSSCHSVSPPLWYTSSDFDAIITNKARIRTQNCAGGSWEKTGLFDFSFGGGIVIPRGDGLVLFQCPGVV